MTAETYNQVSLQMSWALVSHKNGKKEALTDTVSASDVQDNMSLDLTLEEKGGRWNLSKVTWDSISVSWVEKPTVHYHLNELKGIAVLDVVFWILPKEPNQSEK